jgi:hypothetical protein
VSVGDESLASAYERATPPGHQDEPIEVRSNSRVTEAEKSKARGEALDHFNSRAKPHLDRMRVNNTLIEPMPLRQLRRELDARLIEIQKGLI